VLLAIPAGSEDALRATSVGALGVAEVAKPPALAARRSRRSPGACRCDVADPVGNRLEFIQRDEDVSTW
jgi:hypothetical protein